MMAVELPLKQSLFWFFHFGFVSFGLDSLPRVNYNLMIWVETLRFLFCVLSHFNKKIATVIFFYFLLLQCLKCN